MGPFLWRPKSLIIQLGGQQAGCRLWQSERRRVYGKRPHPADYVAKEPEVNRPRAKSSPPPTAPVTPRRPHSFSAHGITITDDYAWLKDTNWQEVLRDPSVLDPDVRAYL